MRAWLRSGMLAAAVLVAGVACAGAGGDDGGALDGDADGRGAACPEDAGRDTVPPLHPSVDGYPSVDVTLVAPDGGCRISMAVLLADSPTRRSHGLMEVPDLPDGTGMLFTYPDAEGPRTGAYWMKDTLVPLDIAYVGADGAIVDVVAMDPCVAAELDAGERCPTYPSAEPYRSALEVPQGWFADIGVSVGWRVAR